jgi:hypothetical protein
MSKKLTPEEGEKIPKEIMASSGDIWEELGPFNKLRDRSKNLFQKLTNYHILELF